MPGISSSAAWKRLLEHTAELKETHLRDLLTDEDRCAATSVTSMGITVRHVAMLSAKIEATARLQWSIILQLDYSRERVSLQTMDLLFDLAETAGTKPLSYAAFCGTMTLTLR